MKYIMKYGPWLAAVLIVALIIYGVVTILNYRPRSEFTMATGREGSAYYEFGQEYQERLAEQGYTLNLVSTAGSIENLQLLAQGDVDVALVQTGTAADVDTADMVSLASLFYEPLWIFYRQEPDSQPILTIPDLKGRSIAVGEAGGGTHDLALFILEENGVTSENSEFYALASSEAAQRILDGDLDAVFMISSLEDPSVMEMLNAPGIELLDIERVLAYQSRYNDVTVKTLGEGAIDLARNIPDQDKHLLSAVAVLVAHTGLEPDLGRLLLTAAEGIHGPGGILESPGEFPAAKLVEIPMNPAAEKFLENGPSSFEKYMPLWIASRLELILFLILPFLVLLYPFFRATPLAVGFFFRFRINRWYRRLRQIELGTDTMNIEELGEQIAWLTDLEQDLAKRLAVPMMYLGDVYLLRFQVGQVSRRLETRRDHLLAQEEFQKSDAQAEESDSPAEPQGLASAPGPSMVDSSSSAASPPPA